MLTLSLVHAFHRNRPHTLSMLSSSGFCPTLTSHPQEPGVVTLRELSVKYVSFTRAMKVLADQNTLLIELCIMQHHSIVSGDTYTMHVLLVHFLL